MSKKHASKCSIRCNACSSPPAHWWCLQCWSVQRMRSAAGSLWSRQMHIHSSQEGVAAVLIRSIASHFPTLWWNVSYILWHLSRTDTMWEQLKLLRGTIRMTLQCLMWQCHTSLCKSEKCHLCPWKQLSQFPRQPGALGPEACHTVLIHPVSGNFSYSGSLPYVIFDNSTLLLGRECSLLRSGCVAQLLLIYEDR